MSAKPGSVGPVPPEAQYICWVQRSLIRNAWPGLAVDANDSAHYRDTVKRFQNENSLPVPVHGEVDPLTQDMLIKLNHSDTHYTAWVQAALVKSGLLKASVGGTDPIMDLPHSLTRQAIRRFQQARSLKSDGWVGPKTELALTKFSATAPPDDTGKSAPCKPIDPKPPVKPKTWVVIEDDQLANKLVQTIDYMEEYGGWYKFELCLAGILLRALRGGELDDGYYTFRVIGPFGMEYSCAQKTGIQGVIRNPTQQHALANFRRCAKAARNLDDVARCLSLVYISMECHLNALLGYLIQQSAVDSGGRPINTAECKSARLIDHTSRRRSPPSIYACLPDLIAGLRPRCRY